MRNQDLATLRMIARLGSFRESAARLNMTLSAVSMQMKALEERLGGKLFDRATRPPRLTALGRAAAHMAEDVLAAEARLLRLGEPDLPLAGSFRLGMVASVGPRLLPAFLSRLRAYPDTRMSIVTGLSEALEAEVSSGSLDAAVVTATGVPLGGLRHLLLDRETLGRAVPEGLPGSAPFLQFAPTTGIGRIIASALAEHPDLADRPRIVLDHVQTILACLDAGIGATILPTSDLGERPSTPLPRMRDLVLVTRKGALADGDVELLGELLLPQRIAASATDSNAASSSAAISSNPGASSM